MNEQREKRLAELRECIVATARELGGVREKELEICREMDSAGSEDARAQLRHVWKEIIADEKRLHEELVSLHDEAIRLLEAEPVDDPNPG